jgi:hypothetical protein
MIPHIMLMGSSLLLAFAICWVTVWLISAYKRGGLIWWLIGVVGTVAAMLPMLMGLNQLFHRLLGFELGKATLIAIFGSIFLTTELVERLLRWRARRT